MSWTAENYFSKAQLYWEKATARGRDNEDFLLNVSFTLEFIARGAVCFVNPALNAACDTESILFACGQEPRTPPRTSDLREILSRLHRLLPTITELELQNIRTLVDGRNSELHGDKAEMTRLTANSLMPSIYSFVVKVAEFAGQRLEALLGIDDAALAKQTADATAHDRSRRVKDLIRVCKERFFALSDAEQRQKRDSATTDIVSAVLMSGHHLLYLKCPACAQSGRLLATPVGRSAAFVRGESLVQEVRIIPFQFTCSCCDLEIRGLDELMSAGFSHEYRSIDEVDPVEHFKIDPRDYIDPEEIAREYYSDSYEYQDE